MPAKPKCGDRWEKEVRMFSSLRTRLVAIGVFIVVAAMVLVTAVNFFTTRAHTLGQLDHQMAELADTQSQAIAAWLRSKQAAVSSMTAAADLPDALPALKAAERAGEFDQTFIGYPDKHAVFSQQRVRPADYDPTQREWYRRANAAGEPVVTRPYIGASSGKLLITFAAPVGPKGSVTAVAGADVLLDTVVSSVLALKPTPHSYAFLVDADGTLIAHPDKSLALKPIDGLSPSLSRETLAAINGSEAGHALQLGGRDTLLYVRSVPGSAWRMAIVLDREEATAALRSIFSTSALATVLFALVAASLLYWMITQALRRLRRLRAAIVAAGEGDFTHRLPQRGNDELTEIAAAFNRFATNIDGVLHKIRVAGDSVKAASQDIASGNNDLSRRTELQAGSLGETAWSISKLTHTVKQNADSADQGNRLAASACEIAVKGGEVVSGVVSMMGSINDSSKKVVDIIGVIDSIAFQTNILALNAAVEAARAGQQGRGFAVVASEVRGLAHRSAEAAKEIKVLIGNSVAKIDDGSALVTEAGETMRDIVESVKRVTGIMGEITTASRVQTSEIEQINQAIAQMEGGTQQNAAMVEQAAAAASSLQDQAANLAQALSVFRLRQEASAEPAPA